MMLVDDPYDKRLIENCHPSGWVNPTPAGKYNLVVIGAGTSEHDSVQRFTKLGVDVFMANACFVGPSTVAVDGRRVEFNRAVIATGARAAEPPISGLQEGGYYTNETIFTLTELPRRLLVEGAGPIGCELAASF